MDKINFKKTVGAFLVTISVLLLMISIVDLFNKVDYITEYKICTDISMTENQLTTCKENATEGLGFKIRENQLDLSVSQYLLVYLSALVKILLSITLLIIGENIYNIKTEKKEMAVTRPIKKGKR